MLKTVCEIRNDGIDFALRDSETVVSTSLDLTIWFKDFLQNRDVLGIDSVCHKTHHRHL